MIHHERLLKHPLIVSHTDRADRVRIISAREGTRNERRFYEDGELLEPDVAQAFPTSDSVNEALRLLIQIAQRQKS